MIDSDLVVDAYRRRFTTTVTMESSGAAGDFSNHMALRSEMERCDGEMMAEGFTFAGLDFTARSAGFVNVEDAIAQGRCGLHPRENATQCPMCAG